MKHYADPIISPCHGDNGGTVIGEWLGNVLVGICSICGKIVIRRNPKTGKLEWLDNESISTEKELRIVE
ncbi:MAG: hypothetical protein PHY72_03735 [Candidatus Pacebacteria bacterium]|nr:hypothetical protein [Candidatus Paceibacterota bacterium]